MAPATPRIIEVGRPKGGAANQREQFQVARIVFPGVGPLPIKTNTTLIQCMYHECIGKPTGIRRTMSEARDKTHQESALIGALDDVAVFWKSQTGGPSHPRYEMYRSLQQFDELKAIFNKQLQHGRSYVEYPTTSPYDILQVLGDFFGLKIFLFVPVRVLKTGRTEFDTFVRGHLAGTPYYLLLEDGNWRMCHRLGPNVIPFANPAVRTGSPAAKEERKAVQYPDIPVIPWKGRPFIGQMQYQNGSPLLWEASGRHGTLKSHEARYSSDTWEKAEVYDVVQGVE